jgi:transcription elongation factor GreA
MQKQFKLTKARFEELKAELNYLRTDREKEIEEQIKEARSFGDLSENSEYDEAKNEQGKLHSRIAELEHIIANTVIIDEAALNKKSVEMGMTVKIEFLADGRQDEYSIVGSQEANPMKKLLSDESPLGKALVGHKEGDTVKVDAPAGSFKCKILTISKS